MPMQPDATERPFLVREVREAPHSERHMLLVIPASVVARERAAAVRELARELVLDGFRPGKVPPEVAERHLPPERIHGEVAQRIVEPHLSALLQEHALEPVAPPALAVEEREGDLHVTVAVPVLPEVPLPPYRDIARAIRETPPPPPSPEEVARTAERMLLMLRRAHAAQSQEGAQGSTTAPPAGDLPPLTDEIARALGPYENVAALRTALEREAATYHAQRAEEVRRGAFITKLLEAVEPFPVPLPFVELELGRLLEAFSQQLALAGLTLEQYLAAQSPERREELGRQWREEAERRVRAHLLLDRIADAEGITVEEGEVRDAVDALLAQNPSLDRTLITRHLQQQERRERLFRTLLGEPQHTPTAEEGGGDPTPAGAGGERTTPSGIIIPGHGS